MPQQSVSSGSWPEAVRRPWRLYPSDADDRAKLGWALDVCHRAGPWLPFAVGARTPPSLQRRWARRHWRSPRLGMQTTTDRVGTGRHPKPDVGRPTASAWCARRTAKYEADDERGRVAGPWTATRDSGPKGGRAGQSLVDADEIDHATCMATAQLNRRVNPGSDASSTSTRVYRRPVLCVSIACEDPGTSSTRPTCAYSRLAFHSPLPWSRRHREH